MRVFFVNNHGGGFASHIEIEADQPVEQFFRERMPGCKPDDYLIRINRLPVAADQLLQEGDRVTITPSKIEGA